MKNSQLILLILSILFIAIAAFLMGMGKLTITLFGTTFPSAPTSGPSSAPSLVLTMAPASITEGGAPATATVTCPTAAAAGGLLVNLLSSKPGEATTPATVTIPAAATSVTFLISSVNEFASDGTQTATITASAAGFSSGTATVSVLDDDTLLLPLTLTIAPPSLITENGAPATVTVTCPTPAPAGGLLVNLLSSDIGEARTPATVTIPAAATSVTFPISPQDDPAFDGTEPVTITASAVGFLNGTATAHVLDDETPLISKLGDLTFVNGVGWKVVYPIHSSLRVGDMLVLVSIPDNLGILTGTDCDKTKNLPTLQLLEGELGFYSRVKNGVVQTAIQYERVGLGGLNFVEIPVP